MIPRRSKRELIRAVEELETDREENELTLIEVLSGIDGGNE